MASAQRALRIVTADSGFHQLTRAAAEGIEGWQVEGPFDSAQVEALEPGGVLLVDSELPGGNIYETCRRLTSRGGSRLLLVLAEPNAEAEGIARFCGAAGVLTRGFGAEALAARLEGFGEFAPQAEFEPDPEPLLPLKLLEDLSAFDQSRPPQLLDALADPETSLFNYDFLTYKLDEEFKRARRFGQPLSCAMLGFDGEADEEVLRELASVFLGASRDTDILGRFDRSSFLFLLPNTPPDGASRMADRILEQVQARGLRDLVGDALELAVGLAAWPHPEVRRATDLYERSLEAYRTASISGGAVSLA
jgi:PleD family two-component response regulator